MYLYDLERLTKLLIKVTPAYEGTAKLKKSLMNIQSSLVSNGQPSEAIEPSECALYHPAVPSQLLIALDATPGDTRYDTSLTQTRLRRAARLALESYPLSACILSGRLRGLPRLLLRGGIASTIS